MSSQCLRNAELKRQATKMLSTTFKVKLAICRKKCHHNKLSWVEHGLLSHQTHYRSYRGRVFTGQMSHHNKPVMITASQLLYQLSYRFNAKETNAHIYIHYIHAPVKQPFSTWTLVSDWPFSSLHYAFCWRDQNFSRTRPIQPSLPGLLLVLLTLLLVFTTIWQPVVQDHSGKPVPDGWTVMHFTEADMMGMADWHWHQLDHMQVICTSRHT